MLSRVFMREQLLMKLMYRPTNMYFTFILPELKFRKGVYTRRTTAEVNVLSAQLFSSHLAGAKLLSYLYIC